MALSAFGVRKDRIGIATCIGQPLPIAAIVMSRRGVTKVLENRSEQAVVTGIASPRPWWMEFILLFGTLGVYSAFWMFARARELRTLTSRRLIPWLWFTVPLLAPAQLVAIPRFIKAWDDVGRPHGLGKWTNWTVPITLGVVSLTVVVAAMDLVPDLVRVEAFLLGWLLCWAGLITGMNARVNRIKRSVPEVTFTGKPRGYTVLEWILLICLSPVTILSISPWAVDELLYSELEGLPAGGSYVDPNGVFRIPVAGDGWRSVEIGKYSVGDAALEIEGPGATMHFIVFEHGRSTSISDLVSMRIGESRDRMTGSRCEESRRFVGNRPIVLSYTECKGHFVLDPALHTVTVFEVDSNVYELYGWLNVTSRSFDRLAVEFRKTARGFEPQ